MSAYSFTMHYLASCLPFILHAFCMVSYKDDLYKLLLVQVMAAPTIPVSAEENLRDPIDIRDTGPTRGGDRRYSGAMNRDAHTEVGRDRGGAADSERERANRVETEGITVRARVKLLELSETWLHGLVRDEKEARERMERQKVIQDSLIEIDLLLDKGNGLPDDLTKRANLFRDLKDIDHKDSINLDQKAKIKWAVEGDENSKFFHGIVNKKRIHLAIKGILVDGEWIENLNCVKSEFYSYYSNLFSAPACDRSLFDFNFPRRLNSDQVFDLEDMVSNEEIKRAVWDCGSDKSPGPDGFTFEFFKKFWTIVGGDVTNAIKEFFISSSFPKCIENSQFIELGQILTSISLSSVSDRWSWTLHGLGDFSVKSAREEIDKHVLVVSPSQNRWSKVLPIKLNVFSWRMMLDRLPTRSNLHNRGISITCILCTNCGAAIENRNHLFFGCPMSVDLARLIGRWWNTHIPIFDDPSSWDSWLNGMNLSSMQRRILEATFISMWWHIWKFRNLTLFSSKKPRKDRIFDDIVSHTYFWLSNRCRSFNVSVDVWLNDPLNAL
nr:RNA-directed DNA polymerase, eukaryota [Tanacetum cinerariifolium]